jgi:hypothetical protein
MSSCSFRTVWRRWRCLVPRTEGHRLIPESPGGKHEIVSLVGTLALDGDHLHIAVSDSTGRTIGGHLMEGSLVYTTAEIAVGEGWPSMRSPARWTRRQRTGSWRSVSADGTHTLTF